MLVRQQRTHWKTERKNSRAATERGRFFFSLFSVFCFCLSSVLCPQPLFVCATWNIRNSISFSLSLALALWHAEYSQSLLNLVLLSPLPLHGYYIHYSGRDTIQVVNGIDMFNLYFQQNAITESPLSLRLHRHHRASHHYTTTGCKHIWMYPKLHQHHVAAAATAQKSSRLCFYQKFMLPMRLLSALGIVVNIFYTRRQR